MMVRCRVRKHNNYGGLPAGMVLDVDEVELKRVPWCLERYEEEVAAEEAKNSARDAEYASDTKKVAEPLVEHRAEVERPKKRR